MKGLLSAAREALLGTAKAPEDTLGVQPAEESKALAQQWRDSTLSSQSLAPGVLKSRPRGPEEADALGEAADGMCAQEAGPWLTAAFGPARSVGEPGAAKRMHAIAFKGRVIVAIYERERGVSWHVALGPAKDPAVDGRSHGFAMLLSWDKEARGFWPEFCQIISEAMKEDPLAFKAQAEARRLELAAGPAAKGRARVRV